MKNPVLYYNNIPIMVMTVLDSKTIEWTDEDGNKTRDGGEGKCVYKDIPFEKVFKRLDEWMRAYPNEPIFIN